jgi:probable HAF family extracellular repeat protein
MSRLTLFCSAVALFVACRPDRLVMLPDGPNQPPVASAGGPYAGAEGRQVTFNARASTDPDQDSLSYLWSFGDGSSAAGSVVEHAFPDDGSYTVTVIVSDPHGAADTARADAVVSNLPPEIVALTARADGPIPVGVAAPLELRIKDPGVADSLTVVVAWGDGAMSEGADPILAHAYQVPGTYRISVMVSDDDGASTSQAMAEATRVYGGYEVIDLGTLGGTSARPYALNDKGQVVGASLTSTGEWRAFIWESGVMREVGVPYAQSGGQAITNSGVISGVGISSVGKTHVFRWNAGATTDLGTVHDYDGEGTRVVGMTGRDVLATYRSQMDRSFSTLWLNGARQNLHGLDNSVAAVMAMNGRGQIVGATIMPGPAVHDVYHALLWENGAVRDLGVLQHFECVDGPGRDCGSSWATDINGKGDVVGNSLDSAYNAHAVLWSAGGAIRDLGPGRSAFVNDEGDVAGDDFRTAFFWRQGVRTALTSLGGAETVVADLNNLSMVTGTSMTAAHKRHVFVWQPGQAILKDLGTGGVPGEGAIAVAINARGDIIGYTCSQGSLNYCSEEASSRAILWKVKQ